MLLRVRRHFTYANVMSTIAAVAALATGGAYAAGTITGKDIKDGTIKSPDIANSQVKAADLAVSAVTSSKLAANAIGSAKVADGSLTSADLAPGTIASIDIADGSVDVNQLANSSVVKSKIAVGAIDSDNINANYTSQVQNYVTTTTTVASALADNTIQDFTADCAPTTHRAIAGGFTLASDETVAVMKTYASDTNSWTVRLSNPVGGGSVNVQVYAICMNA